MDALRGRFTEFRKGCFEGGYWNAGGYAAAIVACVGHAGDWAAYIGGCPPDSEEDGLRHVAASGAKLTEEDARHFFPGVELRYRR